MALLPSFKSELIAYRKWFDAFEAELPKEKRGHWKYVLALEVLDRWQVSGNCEPIWKKLRLKLRCAPAAFISAILLRRYLAEEVAQRLVGWPALESQVLKRQKQHMSRKEYGEATELTALAFVFTATRSKFSQKTKTAARQKFIEELSRMFQEQCGQRLDWIVAALTEIAFGDTITPRAVRDIREQK